MTPGVVVDDAFVSLIRVTLGNCFTRAGNKREYNRIATTPSTNKRPNAPLLPRCRVVSGDNDVARGIERRAASSLSLSLTGRDRASD